LGRPTVQPISVGQRPTFSRRKIAICQSEYSLINTPRLRWYIARYNKLTLGYDTVIRHKWVMVAGSNFTFKIAAKPLQTETWLGLLLTAYRNTSSLYPMIPCRPPTTYRSVIRTSARLPIGIAECVMTLQGHLTSMTFISFEMELVIAVINDTIADPYDVPFSYNTARLALQSAHCAVCAMSLQGHLRSIISVSSEKAYATSY